MNISRRAAFAPGTLKNLKIQWRSFVMFCIYFNLSYMPASLSTVCVYAQYLSNFFQSVDSIRNYIHGVKLLHFYAGCEFGWMDSFELKTLLKGLARLKPHRKRRAAAVTPTILLKLHEYMDLDDPFVLAAWSFFFDCLFFSWPRNQI